MITIHSTEPSPLNRISPKIDTEVARIGQLVKTINHNQHHAPIRQVVKKLYQDLGEGFLENTVQGYGWRKPFGYAGDFLMIDKIYTRHTTTEPEYQAWDEYFHQQAAPYAVRNRKEYFKQLMHRKLQAGKSLTLLNVASGPARDLAEVYADLSHPQQLRTTCVDMDKHAIAYAKQLNQPYLPYMRFVEKNVLRFHCEQKFHLIWSAGLFDYFNDKIFVFVLRRLQKFLRPDGEIIIGNFNQDYNPSRVYMETFGDWFLHHRSEQQLVDLAKKAGFRSSEISLGREPENVNLFLHLKPDGSESSKSTNI
ncbi:MAG: class I SAM-dependent methyltransferase [Bacteroidota bacterium]